MAVGSKCEDVRVLTIVRKVLIDACMQVYRDLEFFFQAENKEQRRKIYNKKMRLEKGYKYSVVCNTFCEMIKDYLVSNYGFDVEVITCDSDEFGHRDIMVNINGNKYIINCLSDLERIQMGMSTKRFASKKYCEERYPNLCVEDNVCYLSDDEIEQIDREIGYYNGMYFDQVIDVIKKEFDDIKLFLKSDEGLRNILIGQIDEKDIEKYEVSEILKVKISFLCQFFNERNGLIGHIELVRIYKFLVKKLFSKEEQKILKMENCFFNRRDNSNLNTGIFAVLDNRVRFISMKVLDDVYLISTVNRKYNYMKDYEWENFKICYDVHTNPLMGSSDSISEVLRNKGIGVNIMKHSIVKSRLLELDFVFLNNKSDEEVKCILDFVGKQGNMVTLVDQNENTYCVNLFDDKIELIENGDRTLYYYFDDDLVEEFSSHPEDSILYVWKDEGIYEKCKVGKSKIKK